MSRSALQKEFLKQQQQMNKPAAPILPPGYLQMQQQQQYYMQMQAQQAMMGMPMMPGMMPPVPVTDPAQGFVPIPLTGDEHDDEGPTVSNVLPMYGNTTNYNINNLLFNNIMENEYFRALYQLRTYHEVIDEIYRSVDHVEPWQTGTSRFPSSAFCLLVKFMLMKLTLKQMKGLLGTTDCPNVRAMGLLYLRYTCPPAELFKWYEPYLEDPEVFSPSADKSATTTIGDYCIKLLTDMQYFGTTLPRIPVPIERKMKVLLLLLEEKKKRRRNNMRDKERGLYDVGAKVRAIYADDENEPAWYEAVIDSIDEDCAEGTKFWVTFPEYGNSERVDLGDMELLPEEGGSTSAGRESRSRSRDRSSAPADSRGGDYRDRDSSRDEGSRGVRGRDSRDRGGGRREDSRDRGRGYRDHRDNSRDRRSRDRESDRNRDRDGIRGTGGSTANLLEKVLQGEREASAAVGKNYGQRPTSYKGSLSLKFDRYTVRQKSPSRDRGGASGSSRRRLRSRSPSPRRNSSRPEADGGGGGSSASAEEQAKRMRLLKERYGDASFSTK